MSGGGPSDGPLVLAFLGCQALGDFVGYHLVATSIARALPGARLYVVYRDDRPYKGFINRCNPAVAGVVRIPGEARYTMSLDSFDPDSTGDRFPFTDEHIALGLHRPDLFLTPSIMSMEVDRCVGPPPRLRIPPAMEPMLAAALKRRGVDPERFFVVVHMRENTYGFRKNIGLVRNVNPFDFLPMIDDIIDRQGGQVVRIGDPEMTPLPPRPGLIELRDANSFPEQMFAVSRARYMVGVQSGPTHLACALGTPAIATFGWWISLWNDGDICLTAPVTFKDGKTLRGRELSELMQFLTVWPSDYVREDNSPEELRDVARTMFARTDNCPGWRIPRPAAAAASAGTVAFPLARRSLHDIADVEMV